MSLQDDLEAIEPENLDALSALLEKHVGEGEAASNDGEGKDESDDTKGESAESTQDDGKGGAAPDTTTPAAKDPDGVLLKDGKTVAPYGVLKGAREARHAAEERARQAEAKAQELSDALDRMKAEASTRQPGETPSDQAKADAALFSEEDLAAMQENFPEMAKLVKGFSAQAQVIADLQKQVTEAKARPAPTAARTDDASDPETVVQQAINARPLLSQWQEKGGIAWSTAIDVDEQLKADPAWKDKPFTERLAEVERQVSEAFGIERTPSKPAPTGGKTTTKTAPKVEKREIETLSDITGRTPLSEQDAIAGMDTNALRQRMDDMTPDQIERFLAKLG